ncbi:MAG: three-Cys-motif partner protein TcmP [Chloroflexota bacterium]|nr:three-Cys-motif partner protein TcmP [Chloroflexota bacterium]
MALVQASDGYVARAVRPWNNEKLHYVARYQSIFSRSMKNKWDKLVYADLLCGPGICISSDGVETSGSPLLALKHAPLARLFFNDADGRAISALEARIARNQLGHGRSVQAVSGDCNEVVAQARNFLFPFGRSEKVLGLVFIDNQGFQMSFDALAELTRGISMDLLITFMTSFPKRFITRPGFGPDSNFARFIGPDAYRRSVENKQEIRTHDLLEAYRRKLRSIGYHYVDDRIRIENTRRQTIYHLVFASRNALGKEFFEKISQSTSAGQARMQM